MAKQLFYRVILTLPLLLGGHDVFAVSEHIDVSVRFVNAIETSTVEPVQFSNILFSAVPTAGDRVLIGTDSSVVSEGVFSGVGSRPQAGVLAFTSSVGSTLNISCDPTASLANASAESAIDFVEIEWDFNRASSAGNASFVCDGAPDTVVSTGNDVVRVGGVLDASTIVGPFSDGIYSTSFAGGSPVVFHITYN